MSTANIFTSDRPARTAHILCLSTMWHDFALRQYDPDTQGLVYLTQAQVEREEATAEYYEGKQRILCPDDCTADYSAWFQYQLYGIESALVDFDGVGLPPQLQNWRDLQTEAELASAYIDAEVYMDQKITDMHLAEEVRRADEGMYGHK